MNRCPGEAIVSKEQWNKKSESDCKLQGEAGLRFWEAIVKSGEGKQHQYELGHRIMGKKCLIISFVTPTPIPNNV